MPAASASFSSVTGRPTASVNRAAPAAPIQDGSRFAAVRTTPPSTTPGNVMPTCSAGPTFAATAATVSTRLVMSAGRGVSSRKRSPDSSPASRSTGAPLTPEPPTSIPTVVMRLHLYPVAAPLYMG